MTDTDDRSLSVKAVAASFMSVACVTVILRCYVRLRVVKSFGWDDAAMVLAMVCCGIYREPRLTDSGMLSHVLRMYDWR